MIAAAALRLSLCNFVVFDLLHLTELRLQANAFLLSFRKLFCRSRFRHLPCYLARSGFPLGTAPALKFQIGLSLGACLCPFDCVLLFKLRHNRLLLHELLCDNFATDLFELLRGNVLFAPGTFLIVDM
jgi:hypothetical protein